MNIGIFLKQFKRWVSGNFLKVWLFLHNNLVMFLFKTTLDEADRLFQQYGCLMLAIFWKPTCPGRSNVHCSTAPTGYLTVVTHRSTIERYSKSIASGYLACATDLTGSGKNTVQLLMTSSTFSHKLKKKCQPNRTYVLTCSSNYWVLLSTGFSSKCVHMFFLLFFSARKIFLVKGYSIILVRVLYSVSSENWR